MSLLLSVFLSFFQALYEPLYLHSLQSPFRKAYETFFFHESARSGDLAVSILENAFLSFCLSVSLSLSLHHFFSLSFYQAFHEPLHLHSLQSSLRKANKTFFFHESPRSGDLAVSILENAFLSFCLSISLSPSFFLSVFLSSPS